MQFVQGLPAGVKVGQTTIQHPQAQVSNIPELSGFNLALHVNDVPSRVHTHRMALLEEFAQYGVRRLTWTTQTHSTICHTVNSEMSLEALVGDGLVTQSKSHALMMMTADCLPVVLGNKDGTEIANLHAGWRGLANGIIENTIAEMKSPAAWAWLGAAISQPCFEVGAEVKDIFGKKNPELQHAFIQGANATKYQADLYAIARFVLEQHGIRVYGGDRCSFTQSEDYYSYRRNAHTGRMATFVFIQ